MKNLAIFFLTALILMGCNSKSEPEHPAKVKEKKSKLTGDTLVQTKTAQAKRNTEPVSDTITEKTQSAKKQIKREQKIISIAELWQTYKSAKLKAEQAVENEDISNTVHNLSIAGDCAVKLGRPEIAAWQFNNIGHYSIEIFKKRTDYENRLRALAEVQTDSLKTIMLAETKNIFSEHLKLLLDAEKYLERAQIVDDDLPESRRTEIIEKNVEFVNWVKDFIK